VPQCFYSTTDVNGDFSFVYAEIKIHCLQETVRLLRANLGSEVLCFIETSMEMKNDDGKFNQNKH
jgi:hypothetical protein